MNTSLAVIPENEYQLDDLKAMLDDLDIYYIEEDYYLLLPEEPQHYQELEDLVRDNALDRNIEVRFE